MGYIPDRAYHFWITSHSTYRREVRRPLDPRGKISGMAAPFTLIRRLLPAVLATTSLCASAGSKAPEPAPRFRAKTTNGQQFNNESIKGKVVLFEFWTTWCKYCAEEASMVDDVAQEFASQGLIVLAVDVLESDKVVQKYLAEHPRSVPIVLTKDTNLAAMYNAQSYPIYVLIDRDGNIAGEQRGAGGEGSLRRLLRRAGVPSAESKDTDNSD